MSIRTQLYLYQYFTIIVNSDSILSVPILYYQCQFWHNFICTSTLLSLWIRTQLYLCRNVTINVNPDTTLSVPVLYYQCQSRLHFICTNDLLSMSIRTQLYLYQCFTINVNSDTTLSVSKLYFQCQSGHNFIYIYPNLFCLNLISKLLIPLFFHSITRLYSRYIIYKSLVYLLTYSLT